MEPDWWFDKDVPPAAVWAQLIAAICFAAAVVGLVWVLGGSVL